MTDALYDRAACGLLTTDARGTIVAINRTLCDWLQTTPSGMVGRAFIDLLTGGGRLYHETHFAPMLSMQGSAREIAFDLRRSDGTRIPVLVNARLDRIGDDGVIHIAVFDATERRSYERELLAAKERAEQSESQVRVLGRAVQDTLLPHRVPTVPGLDVAAVYLPAGAGHEIGGDFYDVFQIARDDWVIALGDVEGKGVEAAVVTAIVRSTIRAASVEHEPEGVLRIVNEVLRRDESRHYCTAVVLRCRRRPHGWAITVSAGGHPLPIKATVAGAEEIGRPGTLLGVFEDVTFSNVELSLGDSEVIVAYTDGITEARSGRAMFGEQRVRVLATQHADRPVTELLDALVSEVIAFGGDPNADDIAAIAIRLPERTR